MRASLLDSVPAPVLEVVRRLRAGGHEAWIVGGSLRDLLAGRAVKDWDLATTARPGDVRGLFRKVLPTGEKHGTVTVLHGGLDLEVTTLRGEGAYSDGRHPDEVFYVSDIVEDLSRRDLTINAMALEPESGSVLDPFGGRADLDAGLVRAVGDPAARFGEDGLRTMRAVRFASTLGFELDPDTEAAIPAALGTFRRVSAERVRDELLKMLGGPAPARALRILHRTALLAEVLPELAAGHGVAQGGEHRHDVLEHSLAVVAACPPPVELRLAAALHDVGKVATRQPGSTAGDFRFPGHEEVGAALSRARLEALKLPRRVVERIVHLVRHHGIPYERHWSGGALRRWLREVGPDRVANLIALRKADAADFVAAEQTLAALAELEGRAAAELAGAPALSTRQLAVDGRALMSHLDLTPGKEVGRLLDQLLEHVVDDPTLNERNRLLALAETLVDRAPDGRCGPLDGGNRS